MRRYKVVHVISSLMVGGAETLLLAVVGRLREHGFDSEVLVLGDEGPLEPRFREMAIPVYRVGMGHGAFPSVLDAMKLARLGRQLAPDLVHGWMSHGNLGSTVVRAVAPGTAALVWSIHQTLGDYRTLPLHTRFAIRATVLLSRRADAIIFVAMSSLAEHRAFGFRNQNAIFVPNGVDTAIFRGGDDRRAEARALLGVPNDVPIIGHVARYHPSKDQATLLSALRIVFASGRDGCAVLIGRGLSTDNRDFATWLCDKQLASHLKLLGPRLDVARLLPGMDLFCLSSAYNEACPVSVLEAMSCGVRCVVTDIADAAWIVGDTGGVAPARDALALATQITLALDASKDDASKASLGARERVLAEFSLDRMIESYRRIYTAAIVRRRMNSPNGF